MATELLKYLNSHALIGRSTIEADGSVKYFWLTNNGWQGASAKDWKRRPRRMRNRQILFNPSSETLLAYLNAQIIAETPQPSDVTKVKRGGSGLYTRAQFDEDMLLADNGEQAISSNVAKGLIDGFEALKQQETIDKFRRLCKNKLLKTRSILQMANDAKRARSAHKMASEVTSDRLLVTDAIVEALLG